MSSIDFICLQAASEAFMVEPIPDNWDDMDEVERSSWLTVNSSSAFENMSADELFSKIDDHSDTVKHAINLTLNKLKEKLIESAIDCSLPSDFNELDLPAMLGMEY